MITFRENETTKDYMKLLRETNEVVQDFSDSALIRYCIRNTALNECVDADEKYNTDFTRKWMEIRQKELKTILD